MEELTGPLEEVFKDLKQKWRSMQEQEPFWDVFMGFIHAINWQVGVWAKRHKAAAGCSVCRCSARWDVLPLILMCAFIRCCGQ